MSTASSRKEREKAKEKEKDHTSSETSTSSSGTSAENVRKQQAVAKAPLARIRRPLIHSSHRAGRWASSPVFTSFSILVLAAIDLLKVEDLAEFNPTFGELLNKLTSSVGQGWRVFCPLR